MAEFHFRQDVKVTTWEQRKFTIEADSEEDAIEYLKTICERDVYEVMDSGDNTHEIDVYDNEFLTEASELISPEENGYNATIEWFNLNGTFNDSIDPIMTNFDQE